MHATWSLTSRWFEHWGWGTGVVLLGVAVFGFGSGSPQGMVVWATAMVFMAWRPVARGTRHFRVGWNAG